MENRYVGIILAAVFDLFDFNGTICAVGPASPVHPLLMDGGKPVVAPFAKQYFPSRMTVLDLESVCGGTVLIFR